MPTGTKPCYLCGCTGSERVDGVVRDRPEIGIRRCTDCGLVFLESFDHIPRDYYDESYTEEQLAGQSWESYLDECRVDDERRSGELAEVPLVTLVGGSLAAPDRAQHQSFQAVPQRWPNSRTGLGFSVAG